MKLTFIILLLTAFNLQSAIYYADFINGNDTNNGSSGSPWKTWARAYQTLQPGDTLRLRDGNYGEIIGGVNRTHLFSNWVTVEADAGYTPELDMVVGGADGSAYHGPERKGTWDWNLVVSGVKILNGVRNLGGRHLTITNCYIQRTAPLFPAVGSPRDQALSYMGRAAVSISSGTNITIANSIITHTAVGVRLKGWGLNIIGNYIHDNVHDCLVLNGAKNSLIKDNIIWGCDDGWKDKEAGAPYEGLHADCIHIYETGYGDNYAAAFMNENVDFINNVWGASEGNGVQVNTYRDDGPRHSGIRFIGNIMGPVSAPNTFNQADGIDNLVFAHNAAISPPGGIIYANPYTQTQKTNNWSNAGIRFGPGTNRINFNNLQYNTAGMNNGWGNMVMGPVGTAALNRFNEYSNGPFFVNPGLFDGILVSNSPAINFGHNFGSLWLDRLNTPRDNRPDAGPYEYPGLTPITWPSPPSYTNAVAIFVDDFEDASLNEDPFLRSPTERGISWAHWTTKRMSHRRSTSVRRNFIADEPTTQNIHAYASNVPITRDLEVKYLAKNNYQSSGAGLTVLTQSTTNFYWFEISSNGRLVRSMMRDGTNQVITLKSDNNYLKLGNSGNKNITVDVSWNTNGILFKVDSTSTGLYEFEYLDTDPLAISTFEPGGFVGFRRSYTANQNHNVEYDNVRITVRDTETTLPPIPDPEPEPEPEPEEIELNPPGNVRVLRIQAGSIILQTP
jgi:hypothetical protein